jgi:hypothetical protein
MRGAATGTGVYVRNVPVLVAIEGNDREIIADLSGSADIALETETDVLLAPREAVMFEGGEAVVRVADAARGRRQLVELGESNDTHFVVRSGLNEGDTLLVSPPAQTQVAVAQ